MFSTVDAPGYRRFTISATDKSGAFFQLQIPEEFKSEYFSEAKVYHLLNRPEQNRLMDFAALLTQEGAIGASVAEAEPPAGVSFKRSEDRHKAMHWLLDKNTGGRAIHSVRVQAWRYVYDNSSSTLSWKKVGPEVFAEK